MVKYPEDLRIEGSVAKGFDAPVHGKAAEG
jgi:hypothetical protein